METLTIPAKDWNAEKGKMEDTSLPEWQEYYKRLKDHEEFCDHYRYFLDRITRHLEWARPSNTWTTDDIQAIIGSEIEKKRSKD